MRKSLPHSLLLCITAYAVLCCSAIFATLRPSDTIIIEKLQYREVNITTGTGFFVTPTTIVTNHHVIDNCRTIWVRGAVPTTRVNIMVTDSKKDLALLNSPNRAPRSAYLRANAGLKKGDDVTVIGYPLERGLTGVYHMEKAKVIDVNTNVQGIQNIEFTQSVEKGNSGGPLLDRSGNIIGVVVGKMHYYHTKNRMKTEEPYKISGLAIGLPVLKDFLKRYNVFTSSQSTYDIFDDIHPDKRAEKYLVNIVCMAP